MLIAGRDSHSASLSLVIITDLFFLSVVSFCRNNGYNSRSCHNIRRFVFQSFFFGLLSWRVTSACRGSLPLYALDSCYFTSFVLLFLFFCQTVGAALALI